MSGTDIFYFVTEQENHARANILLRYALELLERKKIFLVLVADSASKADVLNAVSLR